MGRLKKRCIAQRSEPASVIIFLLIQARDRRAGRGGQGHERRGLRGALAEAAPDDGVLTAEFPPLASDPMLPGD
jgi:hypothetical protein